MVRNLLVPWKEVNNTLGYMNNTKGSVIPMIESTSNQIGIPEAIAPPIPIHEANNPVISIHEAANRVTSMHETTSPFIPMHKFSNPFSLCREAANPWLSMQEDSNPLLPIQEGTNHLVSVPMYSDSSTVVSLHEAARTGDKNTMRKLLMLGYDVNQPDQSGKTPLHYAAMNGLECMVFELSSFGADINIKLPDHFTALHLAVLAGHKHTCWVLLAHGADRTALTRDFKTPLDLAQDTGREDLVEVFTKPLLPEIKTLEENIVKLTVRNIILEKPCNTCKELIQEKNEKLVETSDHIEAIENRSSDFETRWRRQEHFLETQINKLKENYARGQARVEELEKHLSGAKYQIVLLQDIIKTYKDTSSRIQEVKEIIEITNKDNEDFRQLWQNESLKVNIPKISIDKLIKWIYLIHKFVEHLLNCTVGNERKSTHFCDTRINNINELGRSGNQQETKIVSNKFSGISFQHLYSCEALKLSSNSDSLISYVNLFIRLLLNTERKILTKLENIEIKSNRIDDIIRHDENLKNVTLNEPNLQWEVFLEKFYNNFGF